LRVQSLPDGECDFHHAITGVTSLGSHRVEFLVACVAFVIDKLLGITCVVSHMECRTKG
jgi:hypothetical protein